MKKKNLPLSSTSSREIETTLGLSNKTGLCQFSIRHSGHSPILSLTLPMVLCLLEPALGMPNFKYETSYKYFDITEGQMEHLAIHCTL